MRVLITNTVALNGGDAAILYAILDHLDALSVDRRDILVLDSQPEIAGRYYPDIQFANITWSSYQATMASSLFGKRRSRTLWCKRIILATRLIANGFPRLARVLVGDESMKCLRAYVEADLVISTGGTYLVEHYDIRPRILEFEIASGSGTPFVLYTQSLGPFDSPKNRRQLTAVLGEAAHLFVRDEKSSGHLQAIGIPGEMITTCQDVVFSLSDDSHINKYESSERTQPLRVAVSVRKWPAWGKEGMKKYEQLIARLVRHLVEKHRAEVCFVSTCQGIEEYHYDDAAVAASIFASLPSTIQTAVSVDAKHYNPKSLRELYRKCDLVIATRMHASILALLAETPVVNVAYEFKSVELFRSLGWSHCVIDGEQMDFGAARECLDGVIRELQAMVTDVSTKVPRLSESANVPREWLREHVFNTTS